MRLFKSCWNFSRSYIPDKPASPPRRLTARDQSRQLRRLLSGPRVSVLSSESESVILGISFSQSSVIFYGGFICCPYYSRGVILNGQVSKRRELTVLRETFRKIPATCRQPDLYLFETRKFEISPLSRVLRRYSISGGEYWTKMLLDRTVWCIVSHLPGYCHAL